MRRVQASRAAGGGYEPGGSSANVGRLYAAALERLNDAEALLRGGRHTGAVYLAGYAVELSLKAAIGRREGQKLLAKRLQVHDLSALAGKSERFYPQTRFVWRSLTAAGRDAEFEQLARTWSVDLRYVSNDVGKKEASAAVAGARRLMQWANTL